MSGGIAYVYDPDDVFAAKLNVEMVDLQQLDDSTIASSCVRRCTAHCALTESVVRCQRPRRLGTRVAHFKKVMPLTTHVCSA